MSKAGNELLAMLGASKPPPADAGRAICDACAADFAVGPVTLAQMEEGLAIYCRKCYEMAAGPNGLFGDPAPDAGIEAALAAAERWMADGRAAGADRRPLDCADAWVECRDALRPAWAERDRMTAAQRERADAIVFLIPTHMVPEFRG